jgi:hypothetical protein
VAGGAAYRRRGVVSRQAIAPTLSPSHIAAAR